MSPIARIFSVLNLILAASFLAWASTTLAHSQDYKRKYEAEQAAHETTTNDMEAEISEHKTGRDQAVTEAESFRNARDSANERVDRLEGDLGQLRSDLSESQANTQRLTNSVDAIQENNAKLQNDKDRAVETRHEAERAKESAESSQQEAESNLVDAQGEIEGLTNTVSDRDAEIVALNRSISELGTQLTTVVELTGVSFSEITAQPAIDATVVRAVHTISPGLVALNRGTKDGVKVGYTFEIYNGAQYKGQVRVENVRQNMCTALVTTSVSGTLIGQGDSAATRL
jgi:myosin heavy subunit